MNKLENIVKVGVPIVAGVAALALAEYFGVSKFVQDYEIAKSQVASEFFGSFVGGFNYYASFLARGAFDSVVGAIGYIVVDDFLGKRL